jgi:hypothetical protein
MSTTTDLPVDEIHNILSNSRRRAVIHYTVAYADSDDHWPLDANDLTEAIAAHEQDCAPEDLRYKERKRVYISLYQHHLPKLDDYEVVVYDQRSSAIMDLGANARALAQYSAALNDVHANSIASHQPAQIGGEPAASQQSGGAYE